MRQHYWRWGPFELQWDPKYPRWIIRRIDFPPANLYGWIVSCGPLGVLRIRGRQYKFAHFDR